MNYLKHYTRLIQTRKELPRKKGNVEYYENHHIIPKWLGGDDSKDNMVLLTAREHFVAHWLLWKHHRDRKSAFAFHMMTLCWNNQQQRIGSSWQFEIAKKAVFEFQRGENHHRYGKPGTMKGKKHTEEALEKLRRPKSEVHKLNQSKAMKGKYKGRKNGPHSDERKDNISTARLGMKWYTDGNTDIQVKEGDVPQGFTPGRSPQPKPKIVCRISDKKELDAQNWALWVKRQES